MPDHISDTKICSKCGLIFLKEYNITCPACNYQPKEPEADQEPAVSGQLFNNGGSNGNQSGVN